MNRCVLRFWRKEGKEERVGSAVIFEGREFQMVGAAKKKERRPSSDLMRGIWSRILEEEITK